MKNLVTAMALAALTSFGLVSANTEESSKACQEVCQNNEEAKSACAACADDCATCPSEKVSEVAETDEFPSVEEMEKLRAMVEELSKEENDQAAKTES